MPWTLEVVSHPTYAWTNKILEVTLRPSTVLVFFISHSFRTVISRWRGSALKNCSLAFISVWYSNSTSKSVSSPIRTVVWSLAFVIAVSTITTSALPFAWRVEQPPQPQTTLTGSDSWCLANSLDNYCKCYAIIVFNIVIKCADTACNSAMLQEAAINKRLIVDWLDVRFF